ncbi:unnamed protein product [Allacma fusca]|uniref:Neurotransmitter-gated ion-channel transmembrane domain-containing protein n=1 Tax=Allacma fusca TaxID=39272 RepID=A0A8J2LJN3_9HEXA|nr:unnamed protein product [Allacma fusca]
MLRDPVDLRTHSIKKLALWIGVLLSIVTFDLVDGDKNRNERNVTELLNSLLMGYDNSIRPDFGVGYTTRDLIYRWNSNRHVEIAPDMKMSQFDLISTPSGNVTDFLKSGEYSFLVVSFHLQRHTGNFLIEVYGPVSLLVVLSWLSFWLNREATADRVSLGVTIILTITFHFTPLSRTDLPKVPYPTALDFFIYLSFAFIFATIIQFAIVHYFTKHGSGEPCNEDSDEESSDEEIKREKLWINNPYQTPGAAVSFIDSSVPSVTVGDASSSSKVPPIEMKPRRNSNWSFCGRQKKTKKKKQEAINSVSQIDRFSRVMFPMTYIAINVFYWYAYQYSDEDKN